MIMIGAGGRVQAANRAAEEVVSSGDGLAIRHGGVTATEPDAATALTVAIRAAGGDSKGGRRGTTLMVGRPSGSASYRVVVAPLPDAHRTGSEPCAIVLITDPERAIIPAASQLVSLFQMTSAEANVALALCRGERVEDIADERQVSVGTVRCQVKAVFRKTDTDRQADLVRSLLTIPVIREPDAEACCGAGGHAVGRVSARGRSLQ
jgi:DNA-binding CsgD family transcriptional regulator